MGAAGWSAAETMLRLLLAPLAVWLASLAARRWGHAAAGYLGGMPTIGGPITLFLAIDLGPVFAAQSALVTLAAVSGQAAHLVAFGHASRRRQWPAALAAGWLAFAVMSLVATALPLGAAIAAALAYGGLAIAWRLLPRVHGDAPRPAIPAVELRLRLAAALGLAMLILWAAPRFGPVVSGILLSVPITGSIVPPFTLALYGHQSALRVLRGFVVGLSGFSTFFLVVAAMAPTAGTAAAFTAAVAGALVAVFAVGRLLRLHQG